MPSEQELREAMRQQVRVEWDSIAASFPAKTPRDITETLRLQFLHLIDDDPVAVLVMRDTRRNGVVIATTVNVRPHIATAFQRMAIELQQPRFAVRPLIASNRDVRSVPRGILAAIATGRLDYMQ